MEEETLTTDGIFAEKGRKTTIKTRVISEDKHQLKIDEEQTNAITVEKEFLDLVAQHLQNVDVVILQDYNKGVLTPFLIENVIKKANELGVSTIVDPKTKNFLSQELHHFQAKFEEIKAGCNIEFDENVIDEISAATKSLQEKLITKGILLTLSEKGVCMQIVDEFNHTNAEKRNIVDVSGAGDTVIATAALCLAGNIDFVNLSKFANLAGGLVCEKVGVVPIDKTTLLENAITYFGKLGTDFYKNNLKIDDKAQ